MLVDVRGYEIDDREMETDLACLAQTNEWDISKVAAIAQMTLSVCVCLLSSGQSIHLRIFSSCFYFLFIYACWYWTSCGQ